MATQDPVAAEPPTPHRGPGRPRDASRDEAILNATFALLRRRGYQGLTIEGVAAEAGVGRPTIYRRWPSKPALVVAALMDSSQLALPAPNTGSLRDDLIAVQRHQVSLINSPESRRLTAGLLADLATDEELGERYVTEYLMPRRALVFEVLQRGVDRGELTPAVDFAFVYDLLMGPLFMRAVVWGQRLGREAAADTTDVVLARYGAGRGTSG
jgi:AcrR family transcriptional regulator